MELEDDPWGPSYFEDMERIFSMIADRLAPEATVVVEVSNINVDGFRPLVGQMAEALSKCLRLQREIARINTGATPAGPGVDHSALLVFSARN